ncbi:MAG: helix-hairpin-helix domain-containing protein [Candidatus Aureabacteria bacterium]|nr:helix-hairpin-helix domain-containing protein [Candidatus Auribacterota bacterium]
MRMACLLPPVVLAVLLCASPAFCLVDVNKASQSELEDLPGIGPAYAKRIIEGRPYKSINDLKSLKGLGGKTFEKFKDMITAGASKSAKEETPEKAVAQKPIEVPVYSVESYKLFECHKCKNTYRVSSELTSGWCPYCGGKWNVKGAGSAPPESSAKTKAATEVLSFKDAGDYVDRDKSVEGTVVDTNVSRRSGNLYLNFDKDYSTYLSVKILASDLGKFRPDADSYYKGKKIVATGVIKREDADQYLRIIVTDPADLKVVE